MLRQKAKPQYSEPSEDTGSNALAWLGVLFLGILLGTAASQCPKESPQPSYKTPVANLVDFRIHMMDRMENGGCTGINKFLTFTNFTTDLNNMEKEYLEKYSSELGNAFGKSTRLFPPSALTFSLDGYDCEDFALAASCLANYYPNVSCRIYYQAFEKAEHVGLECEEKIGNITYLRRI